MANRNLNGGVNSFEDWSLFLPKYRRIIGDLYHKAGEQDSSVEMGDRKIPATLDLRTLNLSKSVMKQHKSNGNK